MQSVSVCLVSVWCLVSVVSSRFSAAAAAAAEAVNERPMASWFADGLTAPEMAVTINISIQRSNGAKLQGIKRHLQGRTSYPGLQLS